MLKEKFIQFGEGGFLRGFVDWIIKEINEKTDFNAGVCVVQPIKQGLCDVLRAQNHRYTHIARGLKDSKPTVEEKHIDVITRTVKPYDEWEEYLSLAENDDFRFIVSNTTEAGIEFRASDRADLSPEISFPAKLTLLLKRRFDLGKKGFIFLPCELIEQNGAELKRCILKYASLWDYPREFCEWIERENIFYNTLVDRIVTGFPKGESIVAEYNDNMLNTSELFHLWVLEGPKSIEAEIPFKETRLNIIVTDNLERYRTRKVRILNGAHTSMIPYALLMGVQTVGECMENEELLAHLNGCVFDEIIPTLDLPEAELKAYASEVFERFKNPFIKHYCSSIALNSVSKFKVRVLPSILEFVRRKNELPARLCFALAKLIEFYKKGEPQDNEEIVELMKRASVKEILSNVSLWGEDISFLYNEVSKSVKI